MRFSALLALSAAASTFASPALPDQQAPILNEEKYLIELGPGETRWITEDEKWELKRVSAAPQRQQTAELCVGSPTANVNTRRELTSWTSVRHKISA